MKKWYQSKTIWVNIILALVAIVGELSSVFPVSEHPKLWVTVTFVLNTILRLMTTETIQAPKQ